MKNKLLSIFVTITLLFSATNIAYAEETDETQENISIDSPDVSTANDTSSDSSSTSEESSDDLTNKSLENEVLESSEEQLDTNSEDKPDVSIEEKVENDSEIISADELENEPENEPEEGLEDELEDEPENEPENESEDEPENESEDEPEDESEDELEDEFEDELEDENILIETTLVDSDSGLTVNGMLPDGATLSVEYIEPESDLKELLFENNSLMNYDADSFDYMFIEDSYKIIISDENGEKYSPSDKLTISKKLDSDTVNRANDKGFFVYIGAKKIDNSCSKNIVSFDMEPSQSTFSIVGYETYEFCTVTFEILSKNDESFIAENHCRYKIGDKVFIPEFYSDDYQILDNLSWKNVSATANGNVTYTHYIDSSEYNISKNN